MTFREWRAAWMRPSNLGVVMICWGLLLLTLTLTLNRIEAAAGVVVPINDVTMPLFYAYVAARWAIWAFGGALVCVGVFRAISIDLL